MTHNIKNGSPYLPMPLTDEQIKEKLKGCHDMVQERALDLEDVVVCRIASCREERRIRGMLKEIVRLTDQACYKQRFLQG